MADAAWEMLMSVHVGTDATLPTGLPWNKENVIGSEFMGLLSSFIINSP
jgi:hypothetical protein